ncbi:YciI family protein [Ampullimonas aquatilis]|uniref:YciI family protein n=1 Tax=Ampullimonas aquatilis TaxID=1341549 RepID=UPI003C76E973
MFVVQLKFSANKSQAAQWMDGHKAWIKRGFDDGVFLLVGSLPPNLGGGMVAHHITLADLQARLNDDPFVAHDIVSVEIIEIKPAQADDRLKFLLG